MNRYFLLKAAEIGKIMKLSAMLSLSDLVVVGCVVTKHYYKMGKVCIVWPITDAQMATAEIFTKSMNTSSYYFKVKRTSKDSIGEGAQQ